MATTKPTEGERIAKLEERVRALELFAQRTNSRIQAFREAQAEAAAEKKGKK